MNRIPTAISSVSGGLLLFTIMCSPSFALPLWLLFVALLILQVGLIWMVLTILKNGRQSKFTFDQKFYEDRS